MSSSSVGSGVGVGWVKGEPAVSSPSLGSWVLWMFSAVGSEGGGVEVHLVVGGLHGLCGLGGGGWRRPRGQMSWGGWSVWLLLLGRSCLFRALYPLGACGGLLWYAWLWWLPLP